MDGIRVPRADSAAVFQVNFRAENKERGSGIMRHIARKNIDLQTNKQKNSMFQKK